MAEQLLPVAAELVTLVHGDGGPRDVHQALARLDAAQKDALLVVLAGLVDPDQPMGEALAWLDFDENGRLVVPRWEDKRRLRDLVPDPELEADDLFIDPIAVRAYRTGQPVTVSPRERLEAIVQGVNAGGLSYPDFDRMHNLTKGSTSTFISRTRKAFVARGEAFPELQHESGKAVLTDEQVVAIRERFAAGGITDLELAMQYSVTANVITCLLSGRTYPNAGGPIRAKRENKPSEATRTVWAGGQAGFAAGDETKDVAA
ncbi:hypothetical protein ACFQ6Q_00160 [Streptomyces sp. NPDC056437]|uniref:hypothetical protein n=1 Tax=Streptomyces sp. NPDC056437 TaxID=3345816 RepID=UPI0036933402